MEQFKVKPIGKVKVDGDKSSIVLSEEYRPALAGLDGFGYIQVLWWFDGCDSEESRRVLREEKPYRNGPNAMGIFATRSPMRPNPLGLSSACVTGIDYDSGELTLVYIDARNGTPVLDIKPYTPSIDRVEQPVVPGWCAHWPQNVEQSGEFDW
ncbi:SAM-dependent methyltransferase, partial [Christensenellaceae bacterium OttesenSCG-928-K19]|nr:SAM-dependent methyltransferase [Christensenellaceae bacterium OttesenSCG-928-K19]